MILSDKGRGDVNENLSDINYTGYGTRNYADGEYKGDFVNGHKDGNGTYVWKNGDEYVGRWRNEKGNGYGTYTWADGNKYIGDFVDGKMTGRGTYYYSDGRKYVGDFVNNLFDGNGTFTWPDGSRYEGQWKNDYENGYGIYYYAQGDKYEGNFVNDDFDGLGIYFWRNGDKYIGHMKNGKKSGTGKFYTDGSQYIGYWKNDSKYGEYIFTEKNGVVKRGCFEDGECHTLINYSDDYDAEYYVAQAKGNLNLREGPGVDFDVIKQIPKGTTVFISTLDAGYTWRRVLFVQDDVYGFVNKDYLTDFKKVHIDTSGNLQIENVNYKSTSDINLLNDTDRYVTITLGSSLTLKLKPYEKRTVTGLSPGKYKVKATSPRVIPYVGYDIVDEGFVYSWHFFSTNGLVVL